jgi:3-oxoacyl-[acyl-carrier protein] reductase
MSFEPHTGPAVAIVAGGATQPGRDMARGLAIWGWPVVIVYLEDQALAEAAVLELIEAGGTAVAVRADLYDDLDVQRVFTESIASFGVVDVVVIATAEVAGSLYEHAAHYVRGGGAIVSVSAVLVMPPGVESELRERRIKVARVPPEEVLAFLDRWRQERLT